MLSGARVAVVRGVRELCARRGGRPGVRAPLDGRGRVIRSGLAARFITARSIRASEALRGVKRVPPGTVVIWRRGNGPFGHAGFVVSWDGASGETVEGNTSSGQAGSQRDGDGVWRRQRRITPGSYFRIVSFSPPVER